MSIRVRAHQAIRGIGLTRVKRQYDMFLFRLLPQGEAGSKFETFIGEYFRHLNPIRTGGGHIVPPLSRNGV